MATIPTDIQTELTSVSDSKEAIKSAIIDQGVEVSSSDPLSSYADKIRSIVTTIDVDDTISPTSTNPVQNKVIYEALTAKADKTEIKDSDMVIQRNGTAIGTFTANQSSASTINISVPTTAADVNALPSSTVIGSANLTIKRNGTAIGTFSANATVAASVDITVPVTTTALSSGGTAALTSGGAYSNLISEVSAGGAGEILVTKAGVRTTIPVGSSVTVDSSLSESSTNPVQNKVIYEALSGYAAYDTVSESITFGLQVE